MWCFVHWWSLCLVVRVLLSVSVIVLMSCFRIFQHSKHKIDRYVLVYCLYCCYCWWCEGPTWWSAPAWSCCLLIPNHCARDDLLADPLSWPKASKETSLLSTSMISGSAVVGKSWKWMSLIENTGTLAVVELYFYFFFRFAGRFSLSLWLIWGKPMGSHNSNSRCQRWVGC